MLILRNSAIGIFINFVKTIGAGPRQKQDTQTRAGCLAIETPQISLMICAVEPRNMHLLSVSCRESRFPAGGISSSAYLSF